MLKSFAASRSNALVSFIKNKISRNKTTLKESIEKEEITSKYDMLVFGNEEEKLNYKLSTCCNPIPGDMVFGFLSIKEGIKIHKKVCPNALSLRSNYAYRIMSAKWIDSSQQVFRAIVKITGIDRLGLVNSITKVVSENMNVNIKSIKFDTNSELFNGEISVEVNNNNFVIKLMERLQKINGIEKVFRV
jgi:GTP pyrophosphokinase